MLSIHAQQYSRHICMTMIFLTAIFMSGIANTEEDPNQGLSNEIITIPVQDHSITVLVTRRTTDSKFTHAVALFPGSPGYGNLRMEDGEVKFDNLMGNFLVRARRHFLSDGLLTVTLDAPSDQQRAFNHSFRSSERYGQDIKAVLTEINKRFGITDWTFVGHSEGTVSASQAARMLAADIKRVVLTSALTNASKNGVGVEVSEVKKITVPILWVHHKNDPCKYTPYHRTKEYAEETKSPLLTVIGAINRKGDDCNARTEHGFVGMEARTIRTIVGWIRSGKVEPEIID